MEGCAAEPGPVVAEEAGVKSDEGTCKNAEFDYGQLSQLYPKFCNVDQDEYAAVGSTDALGVRIEGSEQDGFEVKLRFNPANDDYEHHVVKMKVLDPNDLLPFSDSTKPFPKEHMHLWDTLNTYQTSVTKS